MAACSVSGQFGNALSPSSCTSAACNTSSSPRWSPIHPSTPSISIKRLDRKVALHIHLECHAFKDMFSKVKISSLQPHCFYDCSFDLLLGTALPCNRIYLLSLVKKNAMEEYVQEALQQGSILLPSSVSFFFIEKKGGKLWLCIDYRGLNQITVKYPYLISLVPSALEQLCSARIFTKLDLHSLYNLICIDAGVQWNTAFSTSYGHYLYRVIPYGLSCTPSIFQCFVHDIQWDMQGKFITYMDDILIYSPC